MPIPTDIDIEDYPVRIFCNNGKTACRHCGDTSHPSFKCLIRPRSEKKCFRCFSVSHMIDQCPNDVVYRHCGQPGHREARCEAKLELHKYGEYKHDIIEGRNAALQEREMSQKNGSNDSRAQNYTMKSATGVTSAIRTKPLTTEKKLASSSTSVDIVSRPSVSQPVSTTNGIKTPTAQTKTTQDEPIVTVIIGDANLKNIDSSLPGAHIQAESGATFLSTRNLMGFAAQQFAGKPSDAVSSVVLHLGTNDVTRHDSGEVMFNARAAVTHIEKKFPGVEQIAVCSIPPRKGTELKHKTTNDSIHAVNSYLQAMCKRSERLLYIDTYSVLVPKGQLARHLYSKTDPSGVHHNKAGKFCPRSWLHS